MNLENQINEDIKSAMKSKEREKLEAIRAIKAAFLLEKTKEGGTGEITDETALKIIQKLIKQRKESAEIYKVNNRNDLFEKEIFEARVMEQYLPKQISDEELTEILKKIIVETGAASQKDMGKVMGTATKQLAGKAEGKNIAEKVKSLLNL
ncbi:MAG: GatB/YqeY domain-containing protein [Bacteroidia bacterium]|nr:GatB/YqeY domain-containing protein [Bacteroidia bacterium]